MWKEKERPASFNVTGKNSRWGRNRRSESYESNHLDESIHLFDTTNGRFTGWHRASTRTVDWKSKFYSELGISILQPKPRLGAFISPLISKIGVNARCLSSFEVLLELHDIPGTKGWVHLHRQFWRGGCTWPLQPPTLTVHFDYLFLHTRA